MAYGESRFKCLLANTTQHLQFRPSGYSIDYFGGSSIEWDDPITIIAWAKEAIAGFTSPPKVGLVNTIDSWSGWDMAVGCDNRLLQVTIFDVNK